MRGGPLSQPAIVKLLHPFVVTAWHGPGEAAMPPDVKEVFSQSAVAKDPKRLNTFMLILDPQGKLVHSFHGLPSGRGANDGRSDYSVEIPKALAQLGLPQGQKPEKERPAILPDLKGTASGVPAGVRLFIHSQRNRTPVVEVVPMKVDEWQTLSFPERSRAIEPDALRSWLVQLYPAAIRTVDQRKPFRTVTGSLKLEPAGADKEGRYALLRGKVHLAKGDDTESAFEGAVQAVVTYRLDGPAVQSVRGVIEGDYLYRMRATQRLPLRAALESRPAADP